MEKNLNQINSVISINVDGRAKNVMKRLYLESLYMQLQKREICRKYYEWFNDYDETIDAELIERQS